MSKKIIVIEDDKDTLDIITYILTEEGYEVIGAENTGPLTQLHLHEPLLILMDNRLPEGPGKDICLRLKNDPATRHFPVALVSADTKLEEIAYEGLADAFLKKPFDIEDLIHLVNRFG
jgi:two-component system, OmpR family, phosphate regulon response regulator PhoB